MPAVLLAAGRGTRLAPLTDTLPKCLVPLAGRPLLDYWLEQCITAGMAPIIVNTHYLKELVVDFVLGSRWRDHVTLFHEENLLGTGGTLLALRQRLDGTFFCAHADNLSFFNMAAFRAAHTARPPECLLTMMLFQSPTPHSCGIVATDHRGVVTEFYEKVPQPPSNLANGAVYIMEPEIFSLLATHGGAEPDSSTHLLPHCLGRMATFLNDDYHRDIGTPESYAHAQADMRHRETPHN